MGNQPATPESVVPESLKELWMDMAEACRTLNRTRWTISDWCRDGILERRPYGRHVLISRESVKKRLSEFLAPAKTNRKPAKKKAKTR